MENFKTKKTVWNVTEGKYEDIYISVPHQYIFLKPLFPHLFLGEFKLGLGSAESGASLV